MPRCGASCRTRGTTARAGLDVLVSAVFVRRQPHLHLNPDNGTATVLTCGGNSATWETTNGGSSWSIAHSLSAAKPAVAISGGPTMRLTGSVPSGLSIRSAAVGAGGESGVGAGVGIRQWRIAPRPICCDRPTVGEPGAGSLGDPLPPLRRWVLGVPHRSDRCRRSRVGSADSVCRRTVVCQSGRSRGGLRGQSLGPSSSGHSRELSVIGTPSEHALLRGRKMACVLGLDPTVQFTVHYLTVARSR